MNKKTLIMTGLLALVGATGVSTYSAEVRAEGVPVKDLTLVQEEGSPKLPFPPKKEIKYYKGNYKGQYQKYQKQYGAYKGTYRFDHESENGISTQGLEMPEMEENQ